MNLSMKPDLQKPTSPSSFSGLFGATAIAEPKVTEFETGIRYENQIEFWRENSNSGSRNFPLGMEME